MKVKGTTGVEMEAMTLCMVTALTIYDMCKAIDKSIELGPFYLLEKSGERAESSDENKDDHRPRFQRT